MIKNKFQSVSQQTDKLAQHPVLYIATGWTYKPIDARRRFSRFPTLARYATVFCLSVACQHFSSLILYPQLYLASWTSVKFRRITMNIPGRALHFVFRIGRRGETINFYRNILGMKVSSSTTGLIEMLGWALGVMYIQAHGSQTVKVFPSAAINLSPL